MLTSTASCTAFRAVLESTGELVAGPVLAARVGHLIALVQEVGAGVLAARWNPADLDLLAAGVGADGRGLPRQAYMAVRRLGWGASPPESVYVSDRVLRCAEEAAGRGLRLAVHRRPIVAAITATWPADPRRRTPAEWTALRAALPPGTSSAEIRNRTRQVQARQRPGSPTAIDLTDLEEPPRSAPQVLLAAADRQLVRLERTGERSAVLHLRLPVAAAPAARRGWVWHALAFTLPPTIPADAKLCTPTLRLNNDRVRLDLPFRTPIPTTKATGHGVALGVDWGVNTLLTATVGRLDGGRVCSDGYRLAYDAGGVSAKLGRLRGHREDLDRRRRHYTALLAGLAPTDQTRRGDLERVLDRASAEHERVCARIGHLNHALAWSAARWAVDQAHALGATALYLEDLATLEARGRRRGNAALSGQVRGSLAAAIRHLAAKVGIAVVTVPARGTSRYCPRCGTGTSKLTHAKAPDRLGTRGWTWAHCPRCGLSGDRDHGAAERILARGLLGQDQTLTDPATGIRRIPAVVEGNVARARRPRTQTRAERRARRTRTDLHPRPEARERNKNRPTPKRATAKRPTRSTGTTSKAFRRPPDRRPVPAPTPTVGQRPAGRAPQTSGTPARTGLVRNSHQRTGFHHAKATPVLTLPEDRNSPPSATPARHA